MKNVLYTTIIIVSTFFLSSCAKTESNIADATPETISIAANTLNAAAGTAVTFTVTSSRNNADITSQSQVFVNGTLITGNSYTFLQAGTYTIFATKGTINTGNITITVTQVSTGFVSKVLVEEYSGTWCGNCPRILYGVDLLNQQTNKAIVVSTHLFNGDPFITTQGNTLAASQGVSSVPTGKINRTISWTGPQYENVAQVINQIQASAPAGLSVSSTVAGNNLTASIKVGYTQALSGNAKLTVYLVEDKLYFTQQNYSSNLYSGQSSIPNFEYNGVIRAVVSSLSGDDIANTGASNEKMYSLTLPANISNIANAKLVAFVTNSAGTVVNVQAAKVGTVIDFERL